MKVIAVILILLLGCALAAGAYYLKREQQKETFFARTTINGYDASGQTPGQLLDQMAADYSNTTIRINEDGEEVITGCLADYGYVVDQEKLLGSLTDCSRKQKSSLMVTIGSLMKGNSYTVTIPFTYYADKLVSLVNTAALPASRFPSVDAQMKYNEEENYYYIEPEVYGNEFPEQEFQAYVRDRINTFVAENNPNSQMEIDFPADLYIKPQITSGDVPMNTMVNVYNQMCKAKITYVFGSVEEVLDWNTIKDWISIENGEGIISDEKAYTYVIDIASRYNTRHYDRSFHTSSGTDIVIPAAENDYGYTVNEDEEFRQLIADIRSNTEVKREPVYYTTNNDYDNPLYLRRDGKDDLAGTYVEVSLTAQHLWFYKDGSLIIDTDIVSGCVAKKSETRTGTFPLAYKESPSVLVGADAVNGYRTEVKYWMPFYEGQGLHDADWRYSFGGNIYMTNGSHGCVNMPPYAAEIVFQNIEAGTAIIIYK